MKENMLLFDLDGTLWDSGTEVAVSWNIVIGEELSDSRKVTVSDIHSVMGKTMDEIALLLFPDLDEKKRTEIFDKCMKCENTYLEEHGAVLFPKVKETLAYLQDQGYKMAVVSNCQTGYIPAFLKSMNVKSYFCDYEEWGNTHLPKSENISLVLKRNGFSKGIYIGDTQKDGDSARTAKVPFIHAAYGFGTDPAPDAVINSFDQLPDVLKKLDIN